MTYLVVVHPMVLLPVQAVVPHVVGVVRRGRLVRRALPAQLVQVGRGRGDLGVTLRVAKPVAAAAAAVCLIKLFSKQASQKRRGRERNG